MQLAVVVVAASLALGRSHIDIMPPDDPRAMTNDLREGTPLMEEFRDALQGTWYVQEMSSGPLPDEQQIVLTFDGGDFVAQTPCNRLTSNYNLSGTDALFGRAESSRVDCTPAQQETERRFRYEMDRAERLEITGTGELQILAADVTGIVATRE